MNNYDLQKFKGDNPPLLSNNLTEKSLSDTNNAITTLWKKESNLEYDLKNKKVKWDEINGIPSDIATHTALTVGIVGDSFPAITDNNNGTITIASCVCNLRTTNSFTSPIRTFKIASAILTATDNTEQYVMISYNNGYPIYILTSNLLLSNSCDYSAVAVIWRIGNVIHYAVFGQNGVGLSNKLNNRALQTEPYKRWIWGGLDLTETATRVVNVSSSVVYSGATPLNISTINSNTGNMYFVYHTNGNWTFTLNTQYNNTQYDDGTNLIISSNNKYLVRFIYRSISSLHNDMFCVSANNHYNTLDLARAAPIPSNLPAVVLRHCMLVGRIIVQYNTSSAVAVESAFAQNFSFTPSVAVSSISATTPIVANAATGDVALSHADSGVAASTYKSVTVDTKGHVTGGTNPTTLAGYGITDAQALDADLTAIAGLTSTSGLLKKTAANTWTLDTSTYLTGNQTITLSGVITGSGTTAITTTMADGALSIAKTIGLQDVLDAKAPLIHGCTVGYIPKAASTTTWANSPIYTDGSNIAIGTTSMQGFGTGYVKINQYTTIGSDNSSYGLIAGNCYYNQAWYPISNGAATCFFSTSNGAFIWRSNTGLVAGTAYTPSTIMSLSSAGILTITSYLSATTASFSNLSIGYLPYKNSSGYLANSLIYTNGANVSIGNISLSEKLDVTGNIKASGYLLSDAWASPTYGGGWYMSDTTWIRTYGSKSIYQNTGILRTDGTLQVGSNGATMNVVTGGDATFGCNVAIGTTSLKNWSATFKALQVGGTCSIMARAAETNTGELYILGNCYFSGLYTAISGVSGNGYATIERRSIEGYTWFGNTGLSANDIISPVRLMSLDYSGNLSVSNLSPRAWHADSYQNIQIGTNLYLGGSRTESSSVGIIISNNTYVNTSNQWITPYAGSASIYNQYLGTHGFYCCITATTNGTWTPSRTACITKTFTIFGEDQLGSSATPYYIDMGKSYANDTVEMSWTKCKFFLYRDDNDGYGFGMGDHSDIFYCASSSDTAGSHNFYVGNINRIKVSSIGLTVSGNIDCSNTKTVYGACFTSWNQSQSCDISSSGTYITLNQNFYAGPLNGVTHANGALTVQADGTYKISFNLFASSTNGGQLVVQLCDTATPEGTQIYVTQAVDAGGSVTISAEILKTTIASDSYYLKITNAQRADTIAVCMINLHVERLSY